MLLKNGDVILEGRIAKNTDVLVRNGKIVDIGHINSDVPDKIIDCAGAYIAPGYIDIHVHGGAGGRFTGDTAEIRKILDAHTKHGTTTMYPTLSTAPLAEMLEAIGMVSDYAAKEQAYCNLAGIHLEGPFLDTEQKGAMKESYIRKPTFEEYSLLLRDPFVKRISYAPEHDENYAMTKYIADRGIIGAIAHSAATIDVMRDVLALGINLITHLYSGMPVVYRKNAFRHLGIPEASYLLEDYNVEAIADAKHLPPDLLRLIYKIKGTENTILITDGTEAAAVGEDAPDFEEIVRKANVIVKDGVAFTPDMQAFSGSITSSDKLVQNMVNLVGVSLPDAVRMLTATPARVMGIADRKGRLAKGLDADILVLDKDLAVKKVIVMGNCLYSEGKRCD